jgi:hypothetical protein
LASKRRVRRKQCGSKRKFETEFEARRNAKRLGICWYKCSFCHKWHLGGSSKGRVRHIKHGLIGGNNWRRK